MDGRTDVCPAWVVSFIPRAEDNVWSDAPADGRSREAFRAEGGHPSTVEHKLSFFAMVSFQAHSVNLAIPHLPCLVVLDKYSLFHWALNERKEPKVLQQLQQL